MEIQKSIQQFINPAISLYQPSYQSIQLSSCPAMLAAASIQLYQLVTPTAALVRKSLWSMGEITCQFRKEEKVVLRKE